MELGGNCPVLIFDDADLNQAADGKRIYYEIVAEEPRVLIDTCSYICIEMATCRTSLYHCK
jgi:hypothetical protein